VYKKSDLYGIDWNRGLTDIASSPENFSLVAVPYYFGAFSATAQNINYEWTDRNSSTKISYNNEARINLSESLEGSLARFNVSVKNASTVFQKAYKNLIITINE